MPQLTKAERNTLNPLEQSFADICAQHGLLDTTVSYSTAISLFTVTHQWPEGDGRGCVHGHGKDIAEAFAAATSQMDARRNPVASPFADVPLVRRVA